MGWKKNGNVARFNWVVWRKNETQAGRNKACEWKKWELHEKKSELTLTKKQKNAVCSQAEKKINTSTPTLVHGKSCLKVTRGASWMGHARPRF